MDKLMSILKRHDIEAFEVAEMIYIYLEQYGTEEDDSLGTELYKAYLATNEEA